MVISLPRFGKLVLRLHITTDGMPFEPWLRLILLVQIKSAILEESQRFYNWRINNIFVVTRHSSLTPFILQGTNSCYTVMKPNIMILSTYSRCELSAQSNFLETEAVTNIIWLYTHTCTKRFTYNAPLI